MRWDRVVPGKWGIVSLVLELKEEEIKLNMEFYIRCEKQERK